MKAKKIFKKINCMFLAIFFTFPLSFFFACSDFDVGVSPTLFVTYRPYASAKHATLDTKTFGEKTYDNLLELSENLLEYLAVNYGLEGEKVNDCKISPYINSKNFEKYLGLNAEPNESKSLNYAEELSSLTHLYIDTNKKIMILTNTNASGLVSKNGDEYSTTYSLSTVSEGAGITSGVLTKNEVYKYKSGDNLSYIFVGGEVDGESYISSGSNFTTTKNFIKYLYDFNYNSIQKTLYGFGTISDGSSSELEFRSWNYGFTGTYTSSNFLQKFVDKYKMKLAVEIAKIFLVGNNSLPTNIQLNNDYIPSSFTTIYNKTSSIINLQSFFEEASSNAPTISSEQKFLEIASVYIDHTGVSESNCDEILEMIRTKIVGETLWPTNQTSSLCYLFKTKFTDRIKYNVLDRFKSSDANKSILSAFCEHNKCVPILEIIEKKNSSILEKGKDEEYFEINGFIQSVVFMAQQPAEVELVHMEVTNSNVEQYRGLLMTRTCTDKIHVKEGYYVNFEEEISKGLLFSLSEDNVIVISGSNSDDVSAENFSFDKNKFPKDTNVYYHAWFFNKKTNFVEFVFASPDIFTLQHFDIIGLYVGYTEA